MTRFEGNCTTTVVRQGKYRLVHHGNQFAIQVVIETDDGIRLYPASREHPELATMVNAVKSKHGDADGGQFYINEFHQVIVPAGKPVDYYLAGEYSADVILILDKQEFSGRPHDDQGNLLKPGDAWTGRPRPGMKYTLKAGGGDVEFSRLLSPGREKVVRLSKIVGPEKARQTARKVAAIRGNKGGPFYVNEYRALFGPVTHEDGWRFVFIGTLTDEDPWFPKWNPSAPANTIALTAKETTAPLERNVSLTSSASGFAPLERKLDIKDGATGHSYDSLFAVYLRGAREVRVEDPYVVKPHQIANLLRFCELLVRLGTVQSIALTTKEISDDSQGRLETIRRSLESFGVRFTYEVSAKLHDRRILTDAGWEINLGRGLDFYKSPDSWSAVGATDFSLRPCHQTTIIFHRMNEQESLKRLA